MISPRVKRVTVAVVAALGTVLGLVLAHPAAADPPGSGVPDAGARPPVGAAQVPAAGGGGSQTPPATLDPQVQQIRAETIAVQALAEQLKQVEEEVGAAAADVEAKREAL